MTGHVHDCVQRINEQLSSYNTRLGSAISFGDQTRELIPILTVKADEKVRRKPASMFATYCPFCGVKLGGAA